jgi:hypothetical protein
LSSDDDDITKIEDIPDFNPEDLDDDFLSLDDLANDMGLSSTPINSEDDVEIDISNITNNDLAMPSIPEDDENDSNEFDSPPNFDVTELEDTSEVFEPRGEEFNIEESTDLFEDQLDDSFSSFDEQITDDFGKSSNDSNSDGFLSGDESNQESDDFSTFSDFSEDSNDELVTKEQDDNFESFSPQEDTVESTIDEAPHDNFETMDAEIPTLDDSFAEEESVNTEDQELKDELIQKEAISSSQLVDVQAPQLSSILTSTDELTPQKESTELTEEKTLIVRDEQETIKPNVEPERFEDIKAFSEKISYGNFSSEGNPPFSVILKDVKFHEDVDSICESLIDLKIIEADTEDHCKESLTRGQMLIPRLSEYAAIILCHKLRSFDIEILMGLTEELHPPKSYESNDRGLSSKYTVYNNRKSHFNFKNSSSTDEILTSTLAKIDDHQIIKHLGIITETKQISAIELTQSAAIEDEIVNQFSSSQKSTINEFRVKKENINASESRVIESIFTEEDKRSTTQLSLDNIYSQLLGQLKLKALKNEANGIVGITFSITPIAIENYLSSGPKYQILCTGNMVWIEKK